MLVLRRPHLFLALLLWAAALLGTALGARAFDLKGYGDILGAYTRTSHDYLGGTTAPGLFPGRASLSTFSLVPYPPISASAPWVQFRDDHNFVFSASELKLEAQQELGDVATAFGSFSLHGAAASKGPGFQGASSDGAFDFLVQQLAITFHIGPVDLTAGRFYAPMGVESVDANRRATVTLGNIFAGLEPFFLTGVLLSFMPEEGAGVFVFAANDLRNGNDDFNDAKAVGGGISLLLEGLTATAQYQVDWSNRSAPELHDATQIVDVSILYEDDLLLIGMDLLWRRENVSGIRDSFGLASGVWGNGNGEVDFFGAELLAGVKAGDWTVGVRGELLHIIDHDRVLAYSVDAGTPQLAGGVFLGDGDVYEASAFLTWALTEGLFVRAEYRVDVTNYDFVNLTSRFPLVPPPPSTVLNPDPASTQLVVLEANATFD